MKRGSKKKLGRKRDNRNMLLRNLATSLILREKITTTLAKAKFVRPEIEKKLKIAKKGDLASKRALFGFFTDRNAVEKIFSELMPFYKDKNSGFTRIIRIGYRVGDGAIKSQIQLIIPDKLEEQRKKKKESFDKAQDREKVKAEVKKAPKKPLLSLKKRSERVVTKVKEKK